MTGDGVWRTTVSVKYPPKDARKLGVRDEGNILDPGTACLRPDLTPACQRTSACINTAAQECQSSTRLSRRLNNPQLREPNWQACQSRCYAASVIGHPHLDSRYVRQPTCSFSELPATMRSSAPKSRATAPKIAVATFILILGAIIVSALRT
jgi:hypothetical protein